MDFKDAWLWILGAVGTAASFLMSRVLSRYDSRLDDHDKRIARVEQLKVSKSELVEFKYDLEKQSDRLDERLVRFEDKIDRLLALRLNDDRHD